VCGNGLASVRRGDTASPTASADLSGRASPDETGSHTVDVLLLYDDATEKAAKLAAAGLGLTAEAYIDSTMRARIETSNLALGQSGVNNLRWRCVGLFKIPAYENAGNRMEADLDLITNATGIAGQYAQDKAVATGADQTILIVSGNRNYSGLAWAPGHHSIVLWSATYMTVAHELGHNFSCQHDRQTEGAKDGNGQFCYGHRFTNGQGRDTGTIMSYAGYRLPYFSNPDIVADGVAMGVSGSQPKAADNARTLREHAAAMADYRVQTAVLEITQQPHSVTVPTGGSITFSVAAIGGNLSYQWSLGGTAISGATAATFSKYSATTGDAGTYTVTVSDTKSSVRSDSVTATVSPASTANLASSAGSGGSGGGGGAPSLWFCGALAMLVMIRRVLGRK
jgi:Metallo-peptidase family M12